MALCFSCFGSCHTFCSATSGASVDCSTWINFARTYVEVSHLLFLGNKGFYHSTFSVMHVTDQFHCDMLLQRCCLSEIFTTSYMNARNFKFVSSEHHIHSFGTGSPSPCHFVPFIVSNRYLLFWVSNGHNSVTVQNRTHVYMNFFDHKDLGNHLLQLCPKVVKHPVYIYIYKKSQSF
jgi:hypothetical protein